MQGWSRTWKSIYPIRNRSADFSAPHDLRGSEMRFQAIVNAMRGATVFIHRNSRQARRSPAAAAPDEN
jgi:hypothetical protein